MDELRAANLAKEIIMALIQHQPELCGKGCLANEKNARELAQSIAALRESLVSHLKQQAD